jgi:hypothetical protein
VVGTLGLARCTGCTDVATVCSAFGVFAIYVRLLERATVPPAPKLSGSRAGAPAAHSQTLAQGPRREAWRRQSKRPPLRCAEIGGVLSPSLALLQVAAAQVCNVHYTERRTPGIVTARQLLSPIAWAPACGRAPSGSGGSARRTCDRRHMASHDSGIRAGRVAPSDQDNSQLQASTFTSS